MSDGDGGGLRLGLVVPSPNIVAERELWSGLPPNYSILSGRVPFDDPDDPADKLAAVNRMNDSLESAVQSVRQGDPLAIGYACTTASFINGDAFDRSLVARLSNTYGVPVITAARAMVRELLRKKASKIALFTVYTADVVARQVSFLEENGFSVVETRTLPLVSAADKRSMTEDRLLDEVAKMRIGKADAVFISCTNIPSFGVLAPLRDKLGVPVLSSNSALLAQLVDAASRSLDARAK